MFIQPRQQRLPQQQGDQIKETSFNSYTFTYNWRIDDLVTKLSKSLPSAFGSDFFSSPSGARPSTIWKLTVYTDEDVADTLEDTPPSTPGEQSLSATLKRLPYQPTPVNSAATVNYLGSAPGLQLRQLGGGLQVGQHVSTSTTSRATHSDDSKTVWVEAILRLQSSNFDDLTEFKPTSFSQGPAELSASSANSGTNVMTFKHCLPLVKVQDAQHIVVECEIKVSSEAPPPPTDESNFSLSRFMEEACQNNLFTDVTLVADGKEYKAHKVVLAAQSQFFSSRFSERWVSPKADGSSGDERVNLTDVPAVIMEAMLAYMYSGKIKDIGSVAHQLLPVAEEYGLVRLRQLCEKELIESLTSKTVINMLIYAVDHNAPNLKKTCIEFIVHNAAAVKRSEGWDKLQADQTHHDVWVELLENIVESLL